jgi:ribosomal protein L37AE/L43A
MCGIRFNHEEFSQQCYVCGKLSLEEELVFYTRWGVWLCESCKEKSEQDDLFLQKIRDSKMFDASR